MMGLLRQIIDLRRRLEQLEAAEPGIIKYVAADIGINPTDANLDAIFGDPTAGDLHDGFIGILHDTSGDSIFLVTVANTSWHYEALTIAA